jgi:hypothetical protein
LGDFTQSCPGEQSRASTHVTWHVPNEHDSGLVHSEFMRHGLPGGGLEPPEHATISRTPGKSHFDALELTVRLPCPDVRASL